MVPVLRKSSLNSMCIVLSFSDTPPYREVYSYLKDLENAKLLDLGVELGLNIAELRKSLPKELAMDLCQSWLREDYEVHKVSGSPTWRSLVRALREVGATGIANKIEQEKITL